MPIKKLKLAYLKPSAWTTYAIVLALIISLPLMVVFSGVVYSGDEVWHHISRQLLPVYAINTIILMLGVAIFTFVMGVSTAWIISMYDFPGRGLLRWALIMPIALPAYISGFTWAGILDYTSPLYVFLRNNFGLDTGQYLFFNLLSMPGAIFILSLSLYPYVYLITSSYFSKQSAVFAEASASLGRSQFQTFFRLVLPMARPAIVAGVSLALMEVLNEYGLVQYFGIDTFTTGIFTAWFSFSNPQSAIKISAYMMIFVLILIITERVQRGKMQYDSIGGQYRPFQRVRLRGLSSLLAITISSIPFLLGFLIPVLMLLNWSFQTWISVTDYRFWGLLGNSFLLAALASMVVLFLSIFIAFTLRSFPGTLMRFLARVITLGYAIPGAVVAIGILIPFLWLDTQLASISPSGIRLALTGTWFALIYAYTVRFMAVGYNSIDSGMDRISKSLDEASESLGMSKLETLKNINLPLIKNAIIGAALLVFIDVLKELPLTLILRPFNFDTLAIRAFEFASDERIAEAAPAAIVIILIGMIPVLFLHKITGKE